jgi:hypothetical protein
VTATGSRSRTARVRNHGEAGRAGLHGDKEVVEKLGRNDLRLCGSGKQFK